MKIERADGVIIRSIPFQDYDQIVTAYTREVGILPFIVKGGRSKNGKMTAAITPLTRIEIVYKPGRGEMVLCKELSPIDQYSELRGNYPLLQAGCDLLKTLACSQWPNKPSVKLYELLITYLENIKDAKDPSTIASSFKLKVLRHDGLLHLNEFCSQCRIAPDKWHISSGEVYCSKHTPPYSIPFSHTEITTIAQLATSRSLKDLLALTTEKETKEKIDHLFNGAIFDKL